VQGVHAEADHALAARRPGVRAEQPLPPHQRLDPRQQLARRERLGQIVVGAHLEADDAVERIAARGAA
jgi:hypothetical protein